MQTLIKWPGGKTSELGIISRFIPEYQRYIEPFFGGGAVFFNMPHKPAIINDISENLMLFYSYIKDGNKKFEQCLYSINVEWDLLKVIATEKAKSILSVFKQYRNDPTQKGALQQLIENICSDITENIIQKTTVIIDRQTFENELLRMASDKVFRTAKNEIKNNQMLSDDDLLDNFLTGFTSGYYMYMRNILNRMERQHEVFFATEYKIAVFYFVREFCYGSMFRYNKTGDFNIPYGGIGYNNKDFKKKIDLLFAKETKAYFSETEIYTNDFEQIMRIATEQDFIFLDPPYDTDFSDYENRSFDSNEQKRLAHCLYQTKAKFLLIIKNTPLISELYQNKGFYIYAFDNTYSYCVKGRNDRNAVHLIITNYECKTV